MVTDLFTDCRGK
jgi:hypothetical protein